MAALATAPSAIAPPSQPLPQGGHPTQQAHSGIPVGSGTECLLAPRRAELMDRPAILQFVHGPEWPQVRAAHRIRNGGLRAVHCGITIPSFATWRTEPLPWPPPQLLALTGYRQIRPGRSTRRRAWSAVRIGICPDRAPPVRHPRQTYSAQHDSLLTSLKNDSATILSASAIVGYTPHSTPR